MKEYIHNEIDHLKNKGHKNIFLLMSKEYERSLFIEQDVPKGSSAEEEFSSVTVLTVESEKVKDWILLTEIK